MASVIDAASPLFSSRGGDISLVLYVAITAALRQGAAEPLEPGDLHLLSTRLNYLLVPNLGEHKGKSP